MKPLCQTCLGDEKVPAPHVGLPYTFPDQPCPDCTATKESTMPFQVQGADGRVIHENLSDLDARELALNLHNATGELAKLIPWVWDPDDRDPVKDTPGRYVLDHDAATTVGAEPVVDEPAAEEFKLPSDRDGLAHWRSAAEHYGIDATGLKKEELAARVKAAHVEATKVA